MKWVICILVAGTIKQNPGAFFGTPCIVKKELGIMYWFDKYQRQNVENQRC